jgi:hypothetical protein
MSNRFSNYLTLRQTFTDQKELVPHSQSSLRENPKFLLNFRPKNDMLRNSFKQIFLFDIYHFNLGENFQILRQKRK